MEADERDRPAGFFAGVRAAAFVALSAVVWLSSVSWFTGANQHKVAARAEELFAAESKAMKTGEGLAEMRAGNPEWDLLTRMFFGLTLAGRAMSHHDRSGEYLADLDRLIDETRALAERHGDSYFLLPYGSPQAFAPGPARSLFVEGELFLLMSARRMAGPGGISDDEARARAEAIARWMGEGPVLSAESYPDECWTFCNTAALAALALHDATSGDDHSSLGKRWVSMAREKLVDPETGLLVSSYRRDGRHLEGPEGSSLWVSTHFLWAIDEDFAREQYAKGSLLLGRDVLGFRLAREWPEGRPPRPDVDSGALLPLLGASAGSSGLYVIAASSFPDRVAREGLLASFELAAFPTGSGESFRYQAAGRVGNAAALYGLSSSSPLFGFSWMKQAARTGS